MKLKFWEKEKRSIDTNIPQDEYGWGIFGGMLYGKVKGISALNIAAVYACIQLISNAIASLPIAVRKAHDLGKDTDNNHSLNVIFKNMMLSKYVYIKRMLMDLLVFGNAYSYIQRAADGTVTDIIYIPFNDVNIRYNKAKRELYYSINNYVGIRGKVEPINIIHIVKDPDEDGVEGRGLYYYAKDTLNLAGITEKNAVQFFESGACLHGILTTGSPNMSAKQISDAKASWNSVYGKTGDKSGVCVLPSNWSYTPTSVNAADAQLLETRLYNLQEVCRFFGVNPTLIGDLSKSSYNTIEASQLNFVLNTLMPYIQLIQEEFTRKLFKPSEAGYTFEFDETFLLKGDKNTTATYLTSLVNAGICSRNEARHFLNLNCIEGLDDIVIAYTDINQNKLTGNEEESNTNIDENTDGE